MTALEVTFILVFYDVMDPEVNHDIGGEDTTVKTAAEQIFVLVKRHVFRIYVTNELIITAEYLETVDTLQWSHISMISLYVRLELCLALCCPVIAFRDRAYITPGIAVGICKKIY